MKKVFLVVDGLLMMHVVSAQIFVNKKNLADVKDVEFIVVFSQGSFAGFTKNFKAKVDLSPFSGSVTNESGEQIVFVNLADLLNTFYKSGWVFHTFKRNEQAIFRRRHD